MRDAVVFFLNGERHSVGGEDAFRNISEFLRYQRGLTGTKVVCAEGDCGACTVLVARYRNGVLGPYRTLNSCIAPVFTLDRCHLVTVEGLKMGDRLHPVQESMIEAHGAQCGYCTPGFICSLASLVEDAKIENGDSLTPKKVRNALTGNLCRCTGYEPIIEAGTRVDLSTAPSIGEIYGPGPMQRAFEALPSDAVEIQHSGRRVHLSQTLDGALEFLSKNPDARVISGSTDLGVVANKRNQRPSVLLGMHSVSELYEVQHEDAFVRVGARVSLSDLEQELKAEFPEFTRSLHLFASPQIKNSGTLVGNFMNASPIGDTIPFLRVAEATLELQSSAGDRLVAVEDFVKPGYKELDLRPGEIVVAIRIPKTQSKFKIYKASNRKDLDISTVAFAARYRVEKGCLVDFALALGGVASSVVRLPSIEARLRGLDLKDPLTPERFHDAASALRTEIHPISDVRASEEYRRQVSYHFLLRFYEEVSV